MQLLTMPFFLILIGICLILSIKNRERRPLKILLPIFFFLLLAVESVCYYFKIIHRNNLIIYNIWFPLEFMFYTYWIVTSSDSKRFKKLFSFLIPIYGITVIVIDLISQSLYSFDSLGYQLGLVLLLPALLFKLYEDMNEPVIQNPLKSPVFWLITGLLISYIFSLSEFSIQTYLHTKDVNLLIALEKVNIILTDVLYITIIIYFILQWKIRKSLI